MENKPCFQTFYQEVALTLRLPTQAEIRLAKPQYLSSRPRCRTFCIISIFPKCQEQKVTVASFNAGRDFMRSWDSSLKIKQLDYMLRIIRSMASWNVWPSSRRSRWPPVWHFWGIEDSLHAISRWSPKWWAGSSTTTHTVFDQRSLIWGFKKAVGHLIGARVYGKRIRTSRSMHHFRARKCLIKGTLLTFSSISNLLAASWKGDFSTPTLEVRVGVGVGDWLIR